MSKAKRSAMMSAVFMGAGQLYNKHIFKGILFAAIEIATIVFMLPGFVRDLIGLITLGDTPQHFVGGVATGDNSLRLLISGFLCVVELLVILGLYIFNIIDAYKLGKLSAVDQSNKQKPTLSTKLDRLFPAFMLSPAFVVSMFLIVFPLLCSLAIAFTNYSSPYHIPPKNLIDWVGFDNFVKLFTGGMWNDTFVGVGKWTVLWAVIATFTVYFAGLILALLTNANGIRFKKFWRSIFALPMVMPGFISLMIFRLAFNAMGPVNQLLNKLGIESVGWLTNTPIARCILILVNLWLGAAGTMVMMSGVLTSIPNEVIEAADLDGANEFQKFRHITLPYVLLSTAPLLVMSFAGNINNFGVSYFLTSGGPVNPEYKFAGDTDILLSWVFKITIENSQYAMASAVSILLFIIIAGVSIFSLRRTKSFKEEDLLQ